MLNAMDRLIGILSRCALAAIIALGGVMLIVTLFAVISRYVLSSSLTWGEELLKILLVWFGLLSVSVISQRREHIGIVIIKDRLPRKLQDTCEIISQVLLVCASVVMVIAGAILVINTRSQLTPALRLPIGASYLAIPISFGFMVVYELRNLLYEVLRISGKIKDRAEENGGPQILPEE